MAPGAGPVPPPRHRAGRGPPPPGPGQPGPLLRPGAATVGGRAEPDHVGTIRPVGPADLRRPPDRPGSDRRARGPGDRPPAPPCARVLAREGPRGRPRHREREGPLLYSGAAGLAGGAAPHEPVRATG